MLAVQTTLPELRTPTRLDPKPTFVSSAKLQLETRFIQCRFPDGSLLSRFETTQSVAHHAVDTRRSRSWDEGGQRCAEIRACRQAACGHDAAVPGRGVHRQNVPTHRLPGPTLFAQGLLPGVRTGSVSITSRRPVISDSRILRAAGDSNGRVASGREGERRCRRPLQHLSPGISPSVGLTRHAAQKENAAPRYNPQYQSPWLAAEKRWRQGNEPIPIKPRFLRQTTPVRSLTPQPFSTRGLRPCTPDGNSLHGARVSTGNH